MTLVIDGWETDASPGKASLRSATVYAVKHRPTCFTVGHLLEIEIPSRGNQLHKRILLADVATTGKVLISHIWFGYKHFGSGVAFAFKLKESTLKVHILRDSIPVTTPYMKFKELINEFEFIIFERIINLYFCGYFVHIILYLAIRDRARPDLPFSYAGLKSRNPKPASAGIATRAADANPLISGRAAMLESVLSMRMVFHPRISNGLRITTDSWHDQERNLYAHFHFHYLRLFVRILRVMST
ncbi:MAG: hypothetical protein L0229_00090, partial [Blastocatellia bacterium]|nr:hypothetical protein [Blastocatellia bacterium]